MEQGHAIVHRGRIEFFAVADRLGHLLNVPQPARACGELNDGREYRVSRPRAERNGDRLDRQHVSDRDLLFAFPAAQEVLHIDDVFLVGQTDPRFQPMMDVGAGETPFPSHFAPGSLPRSAKRAICWGDKWRYLARLSMPKSGMCHP